MAWLYLAKTSQLSDNSWWMDERKKTNEWVILWLNGLEKDLTGRSHQANAFIQEREKGQTKPGLIRIIYSIFRDMWQHLVTGGMLWCEEVGRSWQGLSFQLGLCNSILGRCKSGYFRALTSLLLPFLTNALGTRGCFLESKIKSSVTILESRLWQWGREQMPRGLIFGLNPIPGNFLNAKHLLRSLGKREPLRCWAGLLSSKFWSRVNIQAKDIAPQMSPAKHWGHMLLGREEGWFGALQQKVL